MSAQLHVRQQCCKVRIAIFFSRQIKKTWMEIAKSTASANPSTVLQLRRMLRTKEWIHLPSSKPGGTGLYSQLQERLRQGVNKQASETLCQNLKKKGGELRRCRKCWLCDHEDLSSVPSAHIRTKVWCSRVSSQDQGVRDRQMSVFTVR